MSNNINCTQIQQITKIRYLDMIFDDDLGWNFHICNLVAPFHNTSIHKT